MKFKITIITLFLLFYSFNCEVMMFGINSSDFNIIHDTNAQSINIAEGKDVTVSSFLDSSSSGDKAVDGNTSTTKWIANGNTKPQWMEVDLGSIYNIDRCEIFFEFINAYYQYRVEYSIDGQEWNVFADRLGNKVAGNPKYVDWGKTVSARYIRIVVVDTETDAMWVSIKEFQVYEVEYNGNNIASGKTATASSVLGSNFSADKAFDEDLTSSRWAASDNTKPQWIKVDLGENYNIGKIETYVEFPTDYYKYKIEYSTDNATWYVFADKTQNTLLGDPYVDCGSAIGRYVRITITGTETTPMFACLYEIRIYENNTNAVNIAHGKIATCSSLQDGQKDASKAIDGDSSSTKWVASSSSFPQYIQVDLGKEYNIERFETTFEFSTIYYKYKIESSNDSINWDVIVDRTGNTAKGTPYLDYASATARYVRLTIVGAESTYVWASVKELKVYEAKKDDGNLAYGKTVTASSELNSNLSASKAVDGYYPGSRWAANGSTKPQWIKIDLENTYDVKRIETYFEFLDSYYQYKIEYSTDNINWSTFSDKSSNLIIGNPCYTDTVENTVSARYIKITVTGTETSAMWACVWEIKVFEDDGITATANKIVSGDYELVAENTGSNEYGIGVYYDNGVSTQKKYEQSQPIDILIKDCNEHEHEYSGTYNNVSLVNNKLVCTGTINTSNGSSFEVTDTYSSYDQTGSFKMSRSVSVTNSNSLDKGFNSRYGIYAVSDENITQYDMFAPGNWYKQNKNTVEKSFANDYSHEYFYIREMRLTLPMFMMQNRETGDTAMFYHIDASPSTDISETSKIEWVVDESIQYGAFGIHKLAQPNLDFVYPALEGQTNYMVPTKHWIRRSHPIESNITHSYDLLIKFDNDADGYASALKSSWRYGYDVSNPQTASINESTLYQNALNLLDTYYDNYSGTYGLPFMAYVDDGLVEADDMVMGFVGQQIPAAYQMIRYGYNNSNTSFVDNGSTIVDFWVDESMKNPNDINNPYNLPKTWYDPPNFKSTVSDMRTMCDGMEGAIDAWTVKNSNGINETTWLDYCKTFGDWLVDNINTDGSYYRSYNVVTEDPENTAKYNTINPIRFLLKLYDATNDAAYKTAAVEAGDWAYSNIYQDYMFVGGTSDNDNTIDKEAGIIAMYAFLALYEETSESKWLDAYECAADYVETWTFAWDYDVEQGGSIWAANGSSKPQWLKVDLGQNYNVKETRSHFEFPLAYYQYKIEYSTDDVDWQTFADNTSNKLPSYISYMSDTGNVNARYVKITITGTEDDAMWPAMREFEIIDDTGTNIAYNKQTSASSYNHINPPKRAVDSHIDTSPDCPFPSCGTVGLSLVATGHSYTDMFMAYTANVYYRLYLFTNDTHYLDFAKLVQNNANGTADWNGNLGYEYNGFVEEGQFVSDLKYVGMDLWLNWCSVAQIEPLAYLEDRFGYMSIEDIENNLTWTQRQNLNDN